MADAPAPSFSPAFEALLAIANPWLNEMSPGRIAAAVATDGFAWSDVLGLARRHRVVPFLAERLQTLHLIGDLQPEIAAAVRHEADVANFHEMAMLALVRRLKQSFDEEHVEFLVIKGLVLSSKCYGRLGLRVNRDVDLLVAPAQLDRAHAVLEGMGFTRIEPIAGLESDELERWTKRNKDWVYAGPTAGAVVELHHRLFDNQALFRPDPVARARPARLFGQLEVLTLGADDEVGYLALHGALHAWSRLKWLLDLAFLFRDLGPEELAKRVERQRDAAAMRALRQAATLCGDLFGSNPLPRLKPSWTDSLLVAAARRAMAGSGASELEDSRFGTTLKNISHYLLCQNPAYLAAELAYDLTDTSRDQPGHSGSLPKWFVRPGRWIARHWHRSNAA